MTKQNCPEFISILNNFDIITFQETKTDILDHIELDHFKLYFKHATKCKSGGLCVAIKHYLVPYVSMIKTDCDLVVWFSLSCSFTCKGDVLFDAIYLPPKNSKYALEDPFVVLQKDIDMLCKSYSHMCCLGDFNSRIRNLQGYIEPDCEIFSEIQLNELYNDLNADVTHFDTTHICKQRSHTDLVVNNYGYRFIDF